MDVGRIVSARLKELAGAWPSYAVLGSFVLYLLGYLALRFRLTFLGIGTDLAVIDERYFYEGAKFGVYLVSALPILLLIALAVGLVVWTPYRLFLSSRLRSRVTTSLRRHGRPLLAWCASPVKLSLAGIVFSIVVIQFVMRQPFLYANLLVARELPRHGWLDGLLLTEEEGLRSLYFAGLVAATSLTVATSVVARSRGLSSPLPRGLWNVLAAVAAIQFLFLPINYAFLLTAGELPKLASLGVAETPPRWRDTWLVWEGKDGVTYLVRDTAVGGDRRSLLTLPRKDVGRIEITGYEPILRVLFARPPATR